jgi:hypothetical protein
MREKRLTIQQRREIFRELVHSQDRGMSVAESLKHVVAEHEISEDQLRKIQDEGIDKEWPPLNEAPLTAAASD